MNIFMIMHNLILFETQARTCNIKQTILHNLEMHSWKSNLLSPVIPNSFTDFFAVINLLAIIAVHL